MTLAGLVFANPSHALTFFWDGSDSTANADGGTGTWNTSLTNWDTAASAGTNTSWLNGNHVAHFNGGTGTVTLGENITLAGINGFAGASGSSISAGSGPFTLNFNNTSNTFSLAASSTTGRTLTINPAVAGVAGRNLVINGPATSGSGIVILNGINTYLGATTLQNNVTLRIGGLGSLGSGSYAGTIAIGTGTTFDYNSSTAQNLGGAISGAGALNKTGAGTVTLTAANGHTGTTTITNGTLALTGAGALASTLIDVQAATSIFDVTASGFTLATAKTLTRHWARFSRPSRSPVSPTPGPIGKAT